MREYRVGIVGAGGAVGQEMIKVLEKSPLPVTELRLFATERSAGRRVHFRGGEYVIEPTAPDRFADLDFALFSAGGGPSRELAPEAVERGVVVIDNSSAWRMDPNVPLVVPEVNGEVLSEKGAYAGAKLIANPNCSTIQMVMVLKPIHDAARIKRVVVSTYQAVSGTGHKAVVELEEQIRAYVEGRVARAGTAENKVYPHQIAFNILPHIDKFDETGYTAEEWKMVRETKKILGDETIQVTATTVRVPVFRGHSEAVNIETERKLTPAEAKRILAEAPGVVLVDEPSANLYPMPITAAGRDEVFVGRIREDFSIANGLNLWVVADNLLKGAATNAVQIAVYLAERNLL
ncbi:MAG: aspartate-semialdehyde dehydrogenase [Clostridia bacterium]|nr:aspartate-semialdehyde dehydrogenase [Clostridia bacterium]